jgi:hypothetical protein
MRTGLALFAVLLSALVTPASAKGCLKGAIVGGVVGHPRAGHAAILPRQDLIPPRWFGM